MTDRPTRVRIVGAGRAGRSFAVALGDAGWQVDLVHHDHPDPGTGAARLRGAWFGIAGHPWMQSVVDVLGGTSVTVEDQDRVVYHATAVVASNHLVALMGQVERLAASVGVPLDAFVALARGSLANVAATDPATALTGPVARGDWVTVQRHLDALDPAEREAYRVLAEQAARLAGRRPPWDRVNGVEP